MKRKRHSPEEIIKKLREAATLLAGGPSVEAVCKPLAVSPPTYHRWKRKYSGAKEETIKRLKALERKMASSKNWWRTCPSTKRCSRRLDEKAGVARRMRGLNLLPYENEKPTINDVRGREDG